MKGGVSVEVYQCVLQCYEIDDPVSEQGLYTLQIYLFHEENVEE